MINILVAKKTISLDLVFESNFKNIHKYQTNNQPQYFIKTFLDEFEVPKEEATIKTQFYNLYKYEDKIIQIQIASNNIIGMIMYVNNHISIYLKEKNFITEYLLSQYALVHIIRQMSNAIFMHGSSLSYKDNGIIFSAKSGTGKSTHSRLWQKYSDALIINDDKNIIIYENDKLYLYSSPWSGKHQIDNNIIVPLKTIVFLYQNKTNTIKKLNAISAMKLLLGQVEAPSIENKSNWSFMIDKLLELNIYYYGCNMEPDAFEVIYKEIKENIV